MTIFGKKEEHVGSGVDKADPKSLKEKVVDAFKSVRLAPEAPKADGENDPLQVIPPAD